MVDLTWLYAKYVTLYPETKRTLFLVAVFLVVLLVVIHKP